MPLSLERLRRQAWVRGADERADRALARDRAPSRATPEEDLDLFMVRELGPVSASSRLDLDEVI